MHGRGANGDHFFFRTRGDAECLKKPRPKAGKMSSVDDLCAMVRDAGGILWADKSPFAVYECVVAQLGAAHAGTGSAAVVRFIVDSFRAHDVDCVLGLCAVCVGEKQTFAVGDVSIDPALVFLAEVLRGTSAVLLGFASSARSVTDSPVFVSACGVAPVVFDTTVNVVTVGPCEDERAAMGRWPYTTRELRRHCDEHVVVSTYVPDESGDDVLVPSSTCAAVWPRCRGLMEDLQSRHAVVVAGSGSRPFMVTDVHWFLRVMQLGDDEVRCELGVPLTATDVRQHLPSASRLYERAGGTRGADRTPNDWPTMRTCEDLARRATALDFDVLTRESVCVLYAVRVDATEARRAGAEVVRVEPDGVRVAPRTARRGSCWTRHMWDVGDLPVAVALTHVFSDLSFTAEDVAEAKGRLYMARGAFEAELTSACISITEQISRTGEDPSVMSRGDERDRVWAYALSRRDEHVRRWLSENEGGWEAFCGHRHCPPNVCVMAELVPLPRASFDKFSNK